MKILFTGGGTGGHVFPVIAIAREIRRIYPQAEFLYLGPKDSFVETNLPYEGIRVKTVLAGKFRRYFDPKTILENILDVFKTPIGIIQSFFDVFLSSPDLIFSKGGYGSLPVVIAGWMLRVPIFIHESDVVPGMSNRALARFAWEIFVSFPKTLFLPSEKMILVGNPIRREILEGSKEKGKEIFDIIGDKPILLVLGGSQGAQRINDKILEILPNLLEKFEIIHQVGEQNYEQLKKETKMTIKDVGLAQYYHPVSFLRENELASAYALCDFIVSRAGSGSIFEMAAIGKPSILIPITEAAQNHQVENAYAYGDTGAALVMEEQNFVSHFFLERLTFIFFDQPEIKAKMAEAAAKFAKPMAGKVIAEYIVAYLAGQ